MQSIRRLTVLTALLIAALVALPASASAFAGFVADEYPAAEHGGPWSAAFSVAGYYTECEGMTFEASLEEPSSAMSTESIEDPTCPKGLIEMNGCQLEFHPGTGTTDIGPSECGPVRIFSAECIGNLYVPAQSGLGTEYGNFGSGSKAGVSIYAEETGLEYFTTKANLCMGVGTFEDLGLVAAFNMTATNAAEKATGTAVAGGGNGGEIGLSIEGGGGAGEPRLAGSEYPVQVGGKRLQLGETEGELTLWENPAGKTISCEAVQLDGEELSGPAYGEFSVGGSYSECKLMSGSLEVNVNMGTCQYAYSGLELAAADEYEGTAKIACSVEGDAIKLKMPGCRVEIPAQTLSAPVELSNISSGEGFFPDWLEVGASTSGTGLEYSISGLFCGAAGLKTGPAEDGSMSIDTLIQGMYPG